MYLVDGNALYSILGSEYTKIKYSYAFLKSEYETATVSTQASITYLLNICWLFLQLGKSSLIPKPSHTPVFDGLQCHAQSEGEGARILSHECPLSIDIDHSCYQAFPLCTCTASIQ